MKDCQNFQIQGKRRTCNIWLYPEDNLQLKNLNIDPFDIIICDGPYGILETECEWDDFDLNSKNGREKFRQYYRNLFDACLKHLKKTGSIFIFNYPEGASLIKSVLDEEYPVHFRRWITWVYDNHFDFDRGANFRRSHETILYYTKEPDGFIFKGADIPDVFLHPIIKIRSNSFKDGEKPLPVIRDLLNATFVPEGRLLSLFTGSGTDIVAALEYDMDVVGFEFNVSNFNMLVERIKN
ncbi:site-specific DNA-methyltransferase [candidate division KSB1 bacterium]|nr:site-specific DNA-methyltransferase [candidate division KSB1 bacterium]